MLKDSIISISILTLGIALMAYSFFLAIKMKGMVKRKELKGKCKLILLLIFFFLIGYIVHYYCLIMGHSVVYFTEIMTSLIFCLGAVFVIVVLTINIKLVCGLHKVNSDLSNTNTKLSTINKELLKNTNKLHANNAQVTKAKKEVENKNMVLNAAIEEIYKFRDGKQKDREIMKKDTEKTKRKIDKLKHYLAR